MVVSGEQAPDADLTERSTVPAGIAVQAHVYLAQGGTENLVNLHAFLSDTVLMTGVGFEPPVSIPTWGELDRPTGAPTQRTRPDGGGVVLPRTASGRQHRHVDALCVAIEAAGGARCRCCASLRTAEPELLDRLRSADAMVVTVLAAGERGRRRRRPAVMTMPGTSNTLPPLMFPIPQGLVSDVITRAVGG